MPIINLKQQYPHLLDEILLDVSDPIFEVYDLSRRKESSHTRKMYRYRAQYSLDKGDGIENAVVVRTPSPEQLWLEKVSKAQLREALEHLPPVQSRRIYARFMLDKTIRAIAEAEGVSATSVSGSIKAGLKSMKRYYDKHHWEAR